MTEDEKVENKIPVNFESYDDSYTCPKCGKVYKTTNEWLKSECWFEDHDPIEEESNG